MRDLTMFSSLIWLILLQMHYLDSEHAPWKIYLPIVIIEMIIYLLSLPKIGNWIDNLKKINEE